MVPVAKLFANVFETFEDTDSDDHGRPSTQAVVLHVPTEEVEW